MQRSAVLQPPNFVFAAFDHLFASDQTISANQSCAK
jgi:hypothetical protein